MKFNSQQTLKEIAKIINTDYVGADDFPVLGMNEIHVVASGDIVFVDHPKYYDKALQSAATIILINKDVDCPEGKALLISEDPFRDFNKLSTYFNPFKSAQNSISESAVIGLNTIVQSNVFIGNNVTIGNNCLIHANVTINDNCIVGNNVSIHSGSVLGGDAFYYKNRPEGFDKLISVGKVVLEDHVDIGANCTIDRGVTGETTIGEGTKIDNLVQIGHDTIIGKDCLIGAFTAIAGVAELEDDVILWAKVSIGKDLVVGKGAVLLATAGIAKSVEGGKTYMGAPAIEVRKYWKQQAMMRDFPELVRQLKEKSK